MTIHVEGLTELQRAFNVLDRRVTKDIKSALESAAEPVRSDASRAIRSEVSGMSRSIVPWYTMRTGVTLSEVYVAPLQRGVRVKGGSRRRRPNLADLIQSRLDRALENNILKVEREADEALDDAFRAWSRV